MSLPTAKTKGYGLFRGRVACDCLIEWLPRYEAELLRRKVIKKSIDIYQLTGGASASGGTHSQGGAADLAQTQTEAVYVARQMGADAAWHRKKNWDNRGGMAHHHLVLRGCPHNAPARYQYTSAAYGVDHGHNGLANGAKDDGPKPLSKRTWQEGIAWAKEQAQPATTLSIGQFNFPGDDKLPDPTGRIESMWRIVRPQNLHVIGWNELIGTLAPHKPSDFARAVDARLGTKWLLIKPTLALNENYISYRSDVLTLVHQYDDTVLPSATGGRHLTRVVFRHKNGFTFAVGQTHLVNDGGTQGEKDRQTQAATILKSMQAVVAKHDNCPFYVGGDMNTTAELTAFVKAGMKRTRKYADDSTSRDQTTYTNYEKTKPSTNSADWVIDQQYVTPSFYVVAYNVIYGLVGGLFRKPRASDHALVVTTIRST